MVERKQQMWAISEDAEQFDGDEVVIEMQGAPVVRVDADLRCLGESERPRIQAEALALARDIVAFLNSYDEVCTCDDEVICPSAKRAIADIEARAKPEEGVKTFHRLPDTPEMRAIVAAAAKHLHKNLEPGGEPPETDEEWAVRMGKELTEAGEQEYGPDYPSNKANTAEEVVSSAIATLATAADNLNGPEDIVRIKEALHQAYGELGQMWRDRKDE